MNTLLQLFNDPDINRVFTEQEKAEITKSCVRYLFKLISLPKFKEELSEYGLTTEVWRDSAGTSSMTCRVKLWLRYMSKNPTKKSAKKFDVDPCNRELAEIFKADKELVSQVADIKGPTMTLAQMNKVMANAMLDLTPHVRGRVIKKMRFLRNDSGNDLEDFESELMVHIISGIYAKYPRFESYNHLLNTGRTIANNMSINLIKHYTSQGRNTKFQNADGTFSSNKVSLDVITENRSTGDYEGEDMIMCNSDFAELELQHSLETVLDSPKKRKAFRLLLGYDAKFSKWLVDSKRTTISENNKFQDRLISKGRVKEYIDCIAEYLDTPALVVNMFFEDLAKSMCLDPKKKHYAR